MALVAFPNTILDHFSKGPIDITELRSAIDWIDEYLKTLDQLFNQDQPLTDIAISDFLNIIDLHNNDFKNLRNPFMFLLHTKINDASRENNFHQLNLALKLFKFVEGYEFLAKMDLDAFKKFLEEYESVNQAHLISETLELLPRTLNSLHRFGYTTVEQILEDIQKYGEEEFMRRIPHFGVSQFSDLNTALIKFQTNNTMES